MPGIGTNPFEDSDGGEESAPQVSQHRVAANPFEDSTGYPEGDPGEDGFEESPTDDDNNLVPEASWKFLGDLPYRRVPIYSSVRWKSHSKDTEGKEEGFNHGLAAFPSAYIRNQRQSEFMDVRDMRELLSNTTVTKVVGCPHGGPIAAVTLPVAEASASMGTTELRIMTNSGRSLSNIVFPPRELPRAYSAADIMAIGFTSRMALVIVCRDSLCFTYSLDGRPIIPPFHIMPTSDSTGTELLQASVYEGGVAVLATNMQSAIAELLDDHDEPAYVDGCHLSAREVTSSSPSLAGGVDSSHGKTSPVHFAVVTPLPTARYASMRKFGYVSIAVLPRFHTTSRHPEVFLSTTDNSVVVVNAVSMEMTDVDCRARISSPIVAMTFAPNGRFLACFTQSSILTVISTSFETKVLDFDTSEGSSAPPLDMKWCGEDSVVLHWKNLGVLMVGPYGDWLRFPYENVENLYIIPEIDCCRIITDSSVEFLQRVPPSTALLLRIGSIEPAAMLLDASDAFDSGSAISDETTRAITKTGLLLEAVETCTEAATREFDIQMQKRLLRAASYGMHFAYKEPGDEKIMGGRISEDNIDDDHVMPSSTAMAFVAAARKIRILNALRNPDVGFVLTSAQFDHVTANGVVARLIAMKRPALATFISKYLGLPKAVQLLARASKAAAFIVSDKGRSDSETAEAVIKIINEEPAEGDTLASKERNKTYSVNSGAYAISALAAIRSGRPGVANLLLMLETSVADKVPALISAGSFADASAVATSARDADFIFQTLMECEKACMASVKDVSAGQASFIGTVVTKFTPEAINTLRRYYETMPDVKNVMNLLLRAQRFTDAGAVVAKAAMDPAMDMRERRSMLTESSRVLGLSKDTTFHKLCTEDYLELLDSQEILRSKYGSPEVAPESSSVTSTIVSMIHHAAVNKREAPRLLADADKLAKKFRIPDKRFWHVKVKAFAESNQWENLRLLADSKTKPPVGFKPFASAAIKGNQGVTEIMRYIDRVSAPEERYDLFCEAGLWKRAIDEAVKLKDVRRLSNVRSACNSAEIQEICDNRIVRLGAA